MSYNNQSKAILQTGLAFVWILAIFSSTVTGCLNKLLYLRYDEVVGNHVYKGVLTYIFP